MGGYCDRLSATIAVIAAITEKKSSAIIWKPPSSDRCDNDR